MPNPYKMRRNQRHPDHRIILEKRIRGLDPTIEALHQRGFTLPSVVIAPLYGLTDHAPSIHHAFEGF